MPASWQMGWSCGVAEAGKCWNEVENWLLAEIRDPVEGTGVKIKTAAKAK